MALEGTLKDVPLSDIIQLVLLQRKTGVLTIFRGKELVTISFEKGQVVFSDEFQRSEQERLGAVLLKSKLITPQQLLKAVEMQKQTLQKLGHVLVSNGFLSQDQLRKALQMQVRETIFKLFRWEDGQFKFSQEPVAYDASFYTPIQSDFLVMEGIRRIDEWPLIKKKITSLDLIFDRTEAAEEKIGEGGEANVEEDLDNILSFVDEGDVEKGGKEESRGFKLSPSERITFTLVNGSRTVQALADEGRMGEFETCKALFSLLSLNLIRKVGEAAAPAAAPKAPPRSRALLKVVPIAAVLLVAAVIMMLSPFTFLRTWTASAGTREEVGRAVDNARREKIRFALRCFYLEQKSYPSTLGELIQGGLLRRGEISDHRGEEFTYLREQNGYSLRNAPGWSGREGGR